MNRTEHDRTTAPRRRARRTLSILAVAAAVTASLLAGQRLTSGPPTPLLAPAPSGVVAPEVGTPQPFTPPAPPPPPASLTPEQIHQRVAPTTVHLISSVGWRDTAGTGIVLTPDGLVLTNHHVIDGATDIRAVNQGNGASYDVEVAGYDRTRDLAVLRLAGAAGLPTPALGRSAEVRTGDPVTAIGNADGGGVPMAAGGVVTAIDRTVTARDSADGSTNRLSGLIEVDADIRPGDSGGPLVDDTGAVIGVSTAGTAVSHDDGPTPAPPREIKSYAVPIDEAITVVDQVREGRGSDTVHIGPTPLLGISVSDSVTVPGARVVAVGYGTPAEGAGLVRGDVITTFDGRPIRSAAEHTALMVARHPGDRVELGWTDEAGRPRTAAMVLTTGPPR
ncbi:S1C family serine protease [Rhodococcus sp. NPDC058514]|uniref:S1C family serine protease n=1 Tax=Rhodococcus sp. NPDC058514 TaxID=3346532 RepID=UPI003667E67A